MKTNNKHRNLYMFFSACILEGIYIYCLNQIKPIMSQKVFSFIVAKSTVYGRCIKSAYY